MNFGFPLERHLHRCFLKMIVLLFPDLLRAVSNIPGRLFYIASSTEPSIEGNRLLLTAAPAAGRCVAPVCEPSMIPA